ncbi:MAG TPA: RNA-binding domain-containing protein [Methanomassiliicoccales archaeon]|nr:RNA-binding domain-containing protein [Methanomassiliicoccales archaeon]
MVDTVARARLFPTEDPEKVRKALLNLFPAAEMTTQGDEMIGRTEDLSRFKELIRNHRILDSTRAVMLRGVSEGTIIFQLNKQAAYVGKISFAEGRSPLGPITVVMIVSDPEATVDDVAPSTVDGLIP